MNIKGYRVIVEVESSQPVVEFTGRLVKSFVFALNPHLELMKGFEGILSPLHISPLFKVKLDHDLGEPAYPFAVVSKKEEREIEPLNLNGEFVFHVGGDESTVNNVVDKIGKINGSIFLRIHDALVKYKVEKIVDVTEEVFGKVYQITDKVKVYLKSPAQIFNPYASTKLPKFTPSAIEVLIAPYAILNRNYTITESLVVSSFPAIGKLVETWYSIKTLRPIAIFFKGKKQVNLAGSITYLIQNENAKELEMVQKTLAVAELAGIGRSRQNGFGTTVVVK
ncbi:MAG: hypothetical protein ACP5GN_07510 [Fervidicoccaceae archaeon]|jgi:hypothetical protein